MSGALVHQHHDRLADRNPRERARDVGGTRGIVDPHDNDRSDVDMGILEVCHRIQRQDKRGPEGIVVIATNGKRAQP